MRSYRLSTPHVALLAGVLSLIAGRPDTVRAAEPTDPTPSAAEPPAAAGQEDATPATAPKRGTPTTPPPSEAPEAAEPENTTTTGPEDAERPPPTDPPVTPADAAPVESPPAAAPLPDQLPPEPVAPPEEEEGDDYGTKMPGILFSIFGGVAVPFGGLEGDVDQSDQLAVGPTFAVDLGVSVVGGLSLGAWLQRAVFGGADGCNGCSANSIAVGGFVGYHLAPRGRVDPWATAGVGWRATPISDSSGVDQTYSGLEWLRLQLGVDFFPSSKLGLGPVLELDGGTYSNRSQTDLDDRSPHWTFVGGVRVVFSTADR